jgi:two-component system, cell cycle sensor histidine kinase and response regulator CckA
MDRNSVAPNDRLPFSRPLTLRARMVISFGLLVAVAFLVINLVRTFGIPFTTYSGSYGDHISEAMRNLNLIADLKKDRFLLWLEERKGNAEALARNQVIASSLPDLRKKIQESLESGKKGDALRAEVLGQEIYQRVFQRLRLVKNTHRMYQKIQLADAGEGLILASTEETEVGDDLSGNPHLPKAQTVPDGVCVAIEPDRSNDKTSMVFSVLMHHDSHGNPAVVLMFVDMDAFVKPMLYGGGGLGESDGAMLFNENAQILMPLKHPLRDGRIPKVLETRLDTRAALLAAEGKEGSFIGKDYRGVPVLAATRSLKIMPGVNWGMAVKVDRAEVLGQLWQRVLHSMLLIFACLIAAGVLAVVIAGRISGPIENLSQIAQKVESGDLSTRAEAKGSREMVVLSATFNSMMERVQGWHEELEKEVKDRTARLNELNTELTEEIARRKTAERVLARDNQEWGRIFNAISDLVMILDDQHKIIRANSAMAAALGMTEKEVIGQFCFELVHGKKECPDFCPHARLLADGKDHSSEIFEPRLGGIYDVKVFPLLVQDDQRLRSVHVARNITEEKRKEQKILRQGEFLKDVLDSLTHPFYVIDASDYSILVANRTAQFRDITVGRKCYAATHGRTGPCSGPEHPCPVIEVKKTGKPTTVEHVHFHDEGDLRNIEIHAYPIFNADGEVSQVIEYALDITERKRAEEALRVSEERFKQVAENADEWIWEVDENGMYRYCSSAAERILGYPPDELVGQKYFYDLFPPEVREDLKKETLGIFGRKEKFRAFVNPNLHKNGSIIILETSGSPVQDEQGILLGYRGTDTDVTERKRAEEALERRVIALTRPLDESAGIAFEDLFSLDEIQKLQDQFAKAVGVASLITRADGTPITKPGNFCRLCSEIVRKTEKGRMNCNYSDSVLGRYDPSGPTIQACLSVGLCNAGTSISVGGRHIANWLIGQVRNEMQDTDAVRAYARTIGADEEEFMEAYHEVPYMSQEHFVAVAQALYVLARQLSTVAYQNVQQARFIAERKEAEEALKASEERLRLFIEHAPTALAMFDSDMRYLAVNRRWMSDYRLGDRDIIGRSYYEIFPLTPDSGKAAHRRGLDGEVVRGDEHCFERKHGPAQWVRWEVRPWYTAEGGIGGIVIFAEDITERKQAEAARLSSERKYRALFEESIDGIVFVKRDGEITDANPSFVELLGYTKEEMIGKDIRKLCPDPNDRLRFQAEIEKKGFLKDYELRLRKKDGTEVDCLLTSSVKFGDDGSIAGYRGIVRDLTIRKRLQNQLFQAQKMEAIGTLAGGIAHDFNNLLQIILACSDLLIVQKDKEPPDLRHMEAIRKAAKDGGDLVKGLLTFSRQAPSEIRPVNLNRQLKQIHGSLRRMIPRMIEIKLILADDLGSANADPVQIEQVLMNLAVNAHHAMPKGGKLIMETRNCTLDEDYCSTNAEAKPGEYVMLKISDSGEGMEKEVLDHIFEPFFTTKEAGKGTGLGLAIVYGIVKSHDGHITCSSEPGQGTTFSIFLPAVPGESNPDMAMTTGEMPAFGTEVILLVDDEEPIRKVVAQILKPCGYKVFTAENGNEALKIYREKKDEISLVILDLNMPGMGGTECLEEILKIDPKARVLIASGYSVKESTRKILEVGSSGFIAKPFDAGDLLRAVRRVLDEAGSPRSRAGGSGPVAVRRVEGEGTPAATPLLAEASPEDKAPDITEFPWRLRILAIDDREPYLRMLEAGLAQFGQTLLTASSGIQGLQVFQETSVDLVVCDLGMPELDGWAVGKRIKEICQEKDIPKTPLILLTGQSDMDDTNQEARENMVDCGVDAIVGKPVDIPDLLEVIERLMKKSHGGKG